jgi:putative ABC transport system permease protein
LLTESLLLSGIGSGLGILLAQWGGRLLVRFLDASLDLTLDVPVLGFTASVALLTGIGFGIAPAWQSTRVDPQSALKAGGRGLTEGARFGLGKLLVIVQVALSLVLLVGAGLMLSTFWKLISLDAGFLRDPVLLVTVNLRDGNYPRERWSSVYREMLDRLRSIPGLHSASLSSITPVCHCRWPGEVVVEGFTPKSRDDAMASFNNVSDRYFETLGTRIVVGRDFNSLDTSTSARVAIVSESMAQKYFGPVNPVGRRFRVLDGKLGDPVEIVGVVKDAKYGTLRDEPSPYAFIPWSQGGTAGPLTSFELRVSGGAPTALIPRAKSAIARVNRDVSMEFETLAGKVDSSIEREKLLATLSVFFGALALGLAIIGLYGVMSHNVARRRNEIGIRMALGAEEFRVLRMVLGEVVVLIGIGMAIGLAGALAAARLVSSFLYGLQPNDRWTLASAAALLAGTALIAGYLPARRASSVNPIEALRDE